MTGNLQFIIYLVKDGIIQDKIPPILVEDMIFKDGSTETSVFCGVHLLRLVYQDSKNKKLQKSIEFAQKNKERLVKEVCENSELSVPVRMICKNVCQLI